MHRLPPLVRQVRQWLRRHEVGTEGMVVAVSGGPDSVCLLRALLDLPRRSRPRFLCVAHLNHSLRGSDSNADAAFVENLSETLQRSFPDLSFRVTKEDVARLAEDQKSNVESLARRLRYQWLTQIAQETGSRWVAAGHTADDQAETVLHRLLRGAGLQGLRGIAARRPLAPDIHLIRPLLDCHRSDVLAYLESVHQPFCVDKTNLDRKYTRNRLRHELLPHLAENYNPAIASILCRIASQADETFREEEVRAHKLLTLAERPRVGTLLVFDRRSMNAATRRMARAAFRLLWHRENWTLSDMDFAAWERVVAVAFGELPAVDLPGGVTMRCREHVIQVERK